jgi:zinc protease
MLMNKFLRFAPLLVSLLIGVAVSPPAAAMKIDRVVSPGGIEAWLVQDHTIPALALDFTFRGGSALDPAGKEGAASLLGSMLTEGAGDLDSARFQGTLEDLSISLGFDAGLDTFSGSLRSLTETLATGERLLQLAMTQPRLEAVDLARVKTRTITGLRRAAEEPRTIAGQTWMAKAFPDHPYGRPVRGTPESVEGVTADDLRAFLAARLARDNLIVGASGDITPEALGQLLDRVFAGLPPRATPVAIPETTPQNLGQTIVVRRNVPQSVVTFGHAGIKRDDPDFYAATIVNYVLGGGGFNSRLMNEVREKRGLAYSVSTYLAPYHRAALFMGGTATENARVKESVDVIRQEWKRMHDEGPTADELANAKTYLNGSFPLQLDSMPRIARLLVSIQYDHLGIDYVDRRNGLINGVTLADAKRVAQRLLDPDRLLAVVVGEPQGFVDVPATAAPAGASTPARPAAPTGRGG